MALKTSLHTFDHRVFGSMIDRDDPQVIPNYFASNIENWLIRNRGELVMRPGLTARGVSPGATNLGATQLIRQGTKYLLRVVNGAANSTKFQYSIDGSTWSDATGGGSRTTDVVWKFAQANEYIYGVNGVDTPIRFDGSTITTIAAIPNGVAITFWRNYLWVGGVPSVPDRLYFSTANTPETWGGSDFVNINLGDGSPITGLRGIGGATGRLVIGKERSVWYLTGFASATFAVSALTYEHGVASQESMIEISNQIWGVDLEGNIRGLYRSESDTPFTVLKSKDIPSIISGLNKSSISKSSAVFFDNYAMFFIPNGVDDHNSIVLVWDKLANEGSGGWIKFTNWEIARAVVFNQSSPQLYLFDSNTGNGRAYQWTGTSDNGLAITAKYETKIYDHGFSDRRKNWRWVYQFAPTMGVVSVRFYVSIDRYYYTLVKNFSLSSGAGSLWNVAQWDVDSWSSEGVVQQKIFYTEGGGEHIGYTQQVKLEAESSSAQVKLRRFVSHYRILGLR